MRLIKGRVYALHALTILLQVIPDCSSVLLTLNPNRLDLLQFSLGQDVDYEDNLGHLIDPIVHFFDLIKQAF